MSLEQWEQRPNTKHGLYPDARHIKGVGWCRVEAGDIVNVDTEEVVGQIDRRGDVLPKTQLSPSVVLRLRQAFRVHVRVSSRVVEVVRPHIESGLVTLVVLDTPHFVELVGMRGQLTTVAATLRNRADWNLPPKLRAAARRAAQAIERQLAAAAA